MDNLFPVTAWSHAACMTPTNPRELQALDSYAQDPMRDGDGLLLLDGEVCLELADLASGWQLTGGESLIRLLTSTSRRVLVAIARTGAELRPSDYQLWRELHQGLRDSDVELLPLRALPAV